MDSIASSQSSAGKTGGWQKPAELPLHELSEDNSCAVLKVRPDDLSTDRQTGLGTIDRHRRGGKAGRRSNFRPDQLIEIWILLPIDLNTSHRIRHSVVVRKGWRRHRRTEHKIPPPKKLAPSLLEPRPSSFRRHPVNITPHP